MKIDSHVHFWEYEPVKDAWITDDMAVIQKDFLPADLSPIIDKNGVAGVVAVQASQTMAETEFLIRLSEIAPIIKGVVGWVDLLSEGLEERLAFVAGKSIVKGWRHVVQAEAPGFMLQPVFIKNVQTLLDKGYSYDLLVYHNQLKEASEFLSSLQNHHIVIDHIAKPDIRNLELAHWKKSIEAIAKNYPGVHCKLSGIITEAHWNRWSAAELYPYFDVVFNAFGSGKVLFGSDWPAMLVSGSYEQWITVVQDYLQQFSATDIAAVMGNNAVAFYNL